MGPETNVVDVGVGTAMFDDEIGYSLDRKGAYLPDVRGEIEDTWGDRLIEF